MLGIIHRTILELGPEHFRKFFKLSDEVSSNARNRHWKQIVSHRQGKFLELLANSILGMIDIYNLLPAYTVEATNVKEFQHRLQGMVKDAANAKESEWQNLFCLRKPLHSHAVKKWFQWHGDGPVATKIATNVNENANCVSAWLRFGS